MITLVPTSISSFYLRFVSTTCPNPYRLKKILSQRSCITSRVTDANDSDEGVAEGGGNSASIGEDRNGAFQSSDGKVRSKVDKNVEGTIDLPSEEHKEIKSDKTCR